MGGGMTAGGAVRSESGTTDPIYPWPRFWVPRDGTIDLSDGGFLRDPTDWLAGHRQGRYRSRRFSNRRSLALLGEPGIGKSTTLKEEADRIAALPANASVVSIYVDLRAFPATSFSTGGFSKAKNSSRGRTAVRTCSFISTASTKRCCASIRLPICSHRSCQASRRTACRSASPVALPYGRPIRSGSP